MENVLNFYVEYAISLALRAWILIGETNKEHFMYII